MGKIKDGILDGFSGKVGTVVGAFWRDIATMRALAKPRTVPYSKAELLQQAKFGTLSSFLKPMKDLLNIGFKSFANKMSGANAAQSYNMKNALIVNNGDVLVVCSEALVTRGDLPNVKEAAASSAEKGLVQFNWVDNSGLGKAREADKVLLVVLCHGKDTCSYTFEGGLRRDCAASMRVDDFSGYEVQTWLSFVSKDGEDIATSFFTGQFIVA